MQKKIPQGWMLKKLSDVLDYERPDKYIVKNTSYTKNGKTPVLTANKSFILGYTDEEFGIYKDTPAIIFDDFTTDSKYVDFSFKVKSSAIKILKCKDETADLKFVHEKMGLIKFPIANHKRYYISQYQDLKILLPGIKEQQKIAGILGTVDENILKTQETIEATEKIKRGLMRQLFTRGIGHTKFKKTKIGGIPEKWEIVKLGEIATVERGKFSHRPRNAPEFYGGKHPFIQTGDIISSDGKITTYTQTLNERGLSVSRIFKRGTIVMTIAANIGNTGILAFDSCFPDSLVGISPNNGIDSVFLEYFLRTRKEYLNSIATQSAQKNINLQKLEPMLVVKPVIKEQQQIAEILSAVDEKISVNKKLKAKLTLLKKGLMKDLLSGKVRVEAPHWWYTRCLERPEFKKYYFDTTYEKNKNLLDLDFISQAKVDPFSMFYELYIIDHLKKNSFKIHKGTTGGPDFISDEDKVAFECTVPAVSDDYRYNESDQFEEIDDDLIKLRYSTSFPDKIRQFQKLKKDDYTFIICVCGSKLENGEKDGGISNSDDGRHSVWYSDLGTRDDLMLQHLYGKKPGFMFDGERPKEILLDKKDIQKGNKCISDIHGIFKRKEFNKISGVIFTPYDGVRMKTELKKSFFYKNSNAVNKISQRLIKKIEGFCQTIPVGTGHCPVPTIGKIDNIPQIRNVK